MVWLLAEDDGDVVGAGYALTGWHTPPHRAIGVRARRRRSTRGHGVGDRASATRSSAGPGSTAPPSSTAPSPRTTTAASPGPQRRGYREIGPQLAAGSRPDRDRGAEPSTPPAGIEIVTWAERPELAAGSGRSRARRCRTSRARRRPTPARFEEWLERDMGGAGDDPRSGLRRARSGEPCSATRSCRSRPSDASAPSTTSPASARTGAAEGSRRR